MFPSMIDTFVRWKLLANANRGRFPSLKHSTLEQNNYKIY